MCRQRNRTRLLRHSLNSSEVSYNVKHPTTISSINPTAPYLPKRNENVCLQKDLSTNLYSSFIHHGFKLELFHVSINRMDKPIVHPHNGLLLSNKKERTTFWYILHRDKSQKHAEWKEPDTNEYSLYETMRVETGHLSKPIECTKSET